MKMYNEENIKDEDFYKIFAKTYTEITLNGKAPWLHETTTAVERGIAYNPKSGVVFKGVNSLLLEMQSAKRGWKDSRWISQKELKDLGWKPKDGEYPTPVAYINKFSPPVDVNPVTGEKFTQEKPRQKYYFMYNVEQLKECDLANDKDFFITKGITIEKIKNTVENLKTNNINEIQNKLAEKTIRAVPKNMQTLAAGIVQYRLAQEFRIPYKPQIPLENLEQYKHTKITHDDLLRTAYHSEVAKDRVVSKNLELERDKTRTVERKQTRNNDLERD